MSENKSLVETFSQISEVRSLLPNRSTCGLGRKLAAAILPEFDAEKYKKVLGELHQEISEKSGPDSLVRWQLHQQMNLLAAQCAQEWADVPMVLGFFPSGYATEESLVDHGPGDHYFDGFFFEDVTTGDPAPCALVVGWGPQPLERSIRFTCDGGQWWVDQDWSYSDGQGKYVCWYKSGIFYRQSDCQHRHHYMIMRNIETNTANVLDIYS